jgi:surface antigen
MAFVGVVALLGAMIASPVDQAASGNHFAPGYCTWGAAEEAQRAWGVWLPWYGDAGDWAAAATDAGWRVSAVPQPLSIAAMPRGIQGSGSDGHVAWVLTVSSDGGTITVRSMNWQGRGVTTVHDLLVDGRIQFITPPGPSGGTPDGPAP